MYSKIIDNAKATLEDCEELYTYGIITDTSNGQVVGFRLEDIND